MRKHDAGLKPKADTQAAVRAVIAAAIAERERHTRKLVPPPLPSPKPIR
jgi:Na+-transporting methylmalonyl-CoA/oxaloacetate decarboxylase gamma subunit